MKSIRFEPVLNGRVQKMCAEGGKKGKGKRREKKRKKEEKIGIKIVFFLFCFFISPRSGFFICAVVIFQIYKENCI